VPIEEFDERQCYTITHKAISLTTVGYIKQIAANAFKEYRLFIFVAFIDLLLTVLSSDSFISGWSAICCQYR
jgi:hypothetical protein